MIVEGLGACIIVAEVERVCRREEERAGRYVSVREGDVRYMTVLNATGGCRRVQCMRVKK